MMRPDSAKNNEPRLYEGLDHNVKLLVSGFSLIPDDRRSVLNELASFVRGKLDLSKKAELIFICTHNSRRSHISQIWAQAAAAYYGIPGVTSYSGGTEATAFNPRAVKAMEETGFRIARTSGGDNPSYSVRFSEHADACVVFSKRYDDAANPKKGFAAIMTCSHADENCPVVTGMEKRITLPYDDPKDFDGTPQEAEKYAERVREIGTEVLYAFSRVNLPR